MQLDFKFGFTDVDRIHDQCNMPDGFQLVPRVESKSMENCITVAICAYIVLHGLISDTVLHAVKVKFL